MVYFYIFSSLAAICVLIGLFAISPWFGMAVVFVAVAAAFKLIARFRKPTYAPSPANTEPIGAASEEISVEEMIQRASAFNARRARATNSLSEEELLKAYGPKSTKD